MVRRVAHREGGGGADDRAHDPSGRGEQGGARRIGSGGPTGVLAEVEELKDVCVPRLHVDGEGALPLAAALVNVPRRKEGNDPKVRKKIGVWGTGDEEAARRMAPPGSNTTHTLVL